MPVKFGTNSISLIYNGVNKISKVYRGTDLVYQSYVYSPVIALIERTIEHVDTELTSEITEIGVRAFCGCSSLTSIKIPGSITNIGLEAFRYCTNLTSMTILATTPPTLNSTDAISSATTTIYIPSGSKSAYESANYWKDLLTRATNPVTFIEY